MQAESVTVMVDENAAKVDGDCSDCMVVAIEVDGCSCDLNGLL